jgi:serine/threonine protein kinase
MPMRDNVIIGIIFQIYYTLAATHRVWAQFRHGDLLPHNIRIKMMDDGHMYADGSHYLQYRLDDHVWNVPFYGFFVKIIDFGHSEIPEEGIISSVKHAKDLWIADYVAFIINFEAMLEEAKIISPLINGILKAINTKHLTQLTSPLQLTQLAHTVKTPELALDSNIFSMFEVKVDEELVFKRYTAPSHS